MQYFAGLNVSKNKGAVVAPIFGPRQWNSLASA
jgi:hypothetical protein